jgi:ABC-type uncharacterized transport system substrate-binding protein
MPDDAERGLMAPGTRCAGVVVSTRLAAPRRGGAQARHVGWILRGTRPADHRVEQPIRLERIVNLKPARTLGLTRAPAVLARADEVIR